MSIRDRLARLIAPVAADDGGVNELEHRHLRREHARQRHQETGDPLWPASERHLNPDGSRELRDLTPGTPGAPSSRRRLGR
jgi:hypothetical protein